MLDLGPRPKDVHQAALDAGKDFNSTIWGDGWAEGTIQVLWYPCNWRTVSHDELALLIPSLVRGKSGPSGQDARGPERILRTALLARLRHATLALSDHNSSSPDAIDHARGLIDNSQVLNAIDQNKEWTGSEAAYREMYGRKLIGRSRGWIFRSPAASRAGDERELYELTVLACLDQSLRHAASADAVNDVGEGNYGEAEILLATIHSGLNGAYVYPQLSHLHELFMVGAWLGHLHRGRSAIMPPFIAENIVERFADMLTEANSPVERSTRLLNHYGEMAIGRKRLLRIAHQVQATGEPAIVRPRSWQTHSYGGLLACVERFAESVKRRSRRAAAA